MLRIWHVATHTTNIGDGALVLGIQKTLREDWGVPIDFVSDCLMEYENYWGEKKYDLELVSNINNKSDLLLIGGGGMMDGGRGANRSGMGFNMPLDHLKRIKVPVVYYAVGHNSFAKQIYWHAKKLRGLVDFVLNQEKMLFSVRNDGSLGRLKTLLKSDLNNMWEIPDPGLFVPTKENTHNSFSNDKVNILVQLAGDNPFSRFSSGTWKIIPKIGRMILKKRMHQYLQNVGDALQKVAKKKPVNFVLCPHLVRDFSVLGKFTDSIPKGFSRFNFNATEILRGAEAAPKFFDLYRKADMVIGMRGHSVICGVGLGTPTIALSSHPKVRGFMESVGLEDRIVEINDRHLALNLSQMVNRVMENREKEMDRLSAIRDECRERTKKFHEKMFQLIA